MNVKELEFKHQEIIGTSDLGIPRGLVGVVDYYEEEYSVVKQATNLSIEFAINVLEGLKLRHDLMSDYSSKTHGYKFLCDKIQELKTYLGEKG